MKPEEMDVKTIEKLIELLEVNLDDSLRTGQPCTVEYNNKLRFAIKYLQSQLDVLFLLDTIIGI